MSLLFALLMISAPAQAQPQLIPYQDGSALLLRFPGVPPSLDDEVEHDRIDDSWLALTMGDARKAKFTAHAARDDVRAALIRGDIGAGEASALDAQLVFITNISKRLSAVWDAADEGDFDRAAALLPADAVRDPVVPALYRGALSEEMDALKALFAEMESVRALRDDDRNKSAMQAAWSLTETAGGLYQAWRITDKQLAVVQAQMGSIYEAAEEATSW